MNKLQKAESKQAANSKVWMTMVLSVAALIVTMGTTGCGVSRQPNASASAPSSNARATESSTATASNGNNAAQSPATASSATASNGSSTTNPTPGAAMLSTSASSLSFGNVQTGASTSQLITLTNNSNSNLVISSISTSGSGFSTTGASNITMTANQSVNLYVNFAPTAAGSVSGTVTIASSAMNSMVAISVSGSGVAPQANHSVALSWTPSSSSVTGYFVSRSTTSGGPYTKVSTSADANTSYNDTSVTSGIYFYVVTSVDSSNVESAYSNEVQAIVP